METAGASRPAQLPRWRSPVTALFAIAVVALLAAATLTVAVASGAEGPEACCAGPVADRRAWPSPTTPTAQPTREAGLPSCLIGSWRSVEETWMARFYTDWPELPMVTSGRRYVFRPDGTITEHYNSVTLVGSSRGRDLRIVFNGVRELGWTATGKRITYSDYDGTGSTEAYYDNGRHIDTIRGKRDRDYHGVYDYTCDGNQLVESSKTGYRSTWVRTDAFGVYG